MPADVDPMRRTGKALSVTTNSKLDEAIAELRATVGYMLNAKIDLETGAPKRTALATLEGGIKRARDALARLLDARSLEQSKT